MILNKFQISNENILEEIINHYKKPKHKEILSLWTEKKEAERPMCGDNITIYIQYKDGIIVRASYSGTGCSISQGCADMMCDRIIGLKKEELNNLEFDLFNIEESPISKSRYKCATLSLDALKGIKNEESDN